MISAAEYRVRSPTGMSVAPVTVLFQNAKGVASPSNHQAPCVRDGIIRIEHDG
jgi:hypothetical protein